MKTEEQILDTVDGPAKLAVTASDPESSGGPDSRGTFTNNSTGGVDKVEGRPSDETKSNTEEEFKSQQENNTAVGVVKNNRISSKSPSDKTSADSNKVKLAQVITSEIYLKQRKR